MRTPYDGADGMVLSMKLVDENHNSKRYICYTFYFEVMAIPLYKSKYKSDLNQRFPSFQELLGSMICKHL